MSPRSGLSTLRELLPGRKAEIAARLVCAGHRPHPSKFAEAGLSLSPVEEQQLAAWWDDGLSTRVADEVAARDGTIRMVLDLTDGERVEAVAMPVGAVCVSTQVGCAVGCRFCASGLFGVRRNLTADEIVEQVVHARRRLPIDRVVFMGMGEPTHNLDTVLTAIARIKDEAQIGARRQTLSTVGSVRAFERMAAAPVRPCLALSLHLADDARRRELLPRAYKEPIAEIVAAANAYGREVGTPVQIEWTLLAGVNDGDEAIDALCALLQGVRCYVNFIVWNPVDGMPFAAPARDRIVEIVRRVKRANILATIRDSSGPDADAACGQLRLRHHEMPAVPPAG
ncbi:MAG: radical SAM protein [Planctomycetes bacterium]|nr:radical SAM protein [Planctomycetota bacterium]